MTTQYTSILKLALPVQGELSGTWGDVVNDNITSMVEEAVAGRAVINTWTTNSHTLTTADGTTSEARCAMLEFTDTGAALTGAATVVCPSASKLYVCKNDSGQQVTIQTAAGTGVAIPDGETMFVFCDGTNVEQCETNFNSLSYNGYTLNFGGAVTTAGAFTTSGAYALTLTTTGATDVTLPTTGTLATLDGTETLTNKTLTAPTISSPSLTGSISATDLTISGNTTIGDASADTLTVNSTITSNLIFTDDTYDIGAVGATRPRNLYLSGDATIGGTVTLSGGIDVTGALGVDGDFDVNTDKFTVASATGNTLVAGTLGVTGITTATGGLNVDTINEITAAGGVAIDGLTIKDGDAIFADSDKAIFGADSDLEIYHNGTSNIIDTKGVALKITGTGTSDQLVLENTDDGSVSAPDLRFYRNSASPAADDFIARIDFNGNDDGGNASNFGTVLVQATDVSAGAEDGQIEFLTYVAGSETSMLKLNTLGVSTTQDFFSDKHGSVTTQNTYIAMGTEQAGYTGGTQAYRITTNQDFLIGQQSTPQTAYGGSAVGGNTPALQLESANTTSDASIFLRTNYSAAAGAGGLYFARSRGSSIGSQTIPNDGDYLGSIIWAGSDGTDTQNEAASIQVRVAGTPGANDMPARILINTNSGQINAGTRVRIGPTGKINFNGGDAITAFGSYDFQQVGSDTAGDGLAVINTSGSSLRLYVDGDGLRHINSGSTSFIDFTNDGSLTTHIAMNFNTAINPDGEAIDSSFPAAPLHVKSSETVAGTMILESTSGSSASAPDLFMYNNSPTPADGDNIANLLIQSNDDGGTKTNMAQFIWRATDVSNSSETSDLRMATMLTGTLDYRLRIDEAGRVRAGVGEFDPRGNLTNGAEGAQFSVEGPSATSANIAAIRNTNSGAGPYFTLAKTRSSSAGGQTIVQDGDVLGQISFQGSDGTNFIRSAEIEGYVNETTPSTNNVGGGINIKTTLTSSTTTRLNVTASGRIGLGGQAQPEGTVTVIGDADDVTAGFAVFSSDLAYTARIWVGTDGTRRLVAGTTTAMTFDSDGSKTTFPNGAGINVLGPSIIRHTDVTVTNLGATPPTMMVVYNDAGRNYNIDPSVELVVERASGAGIAIVTNSPNDSFIWFGDDTDGDIGRIRYDHSQNNLEFYTNNSQAAYFGSSGNLVFPDGQGLLFSASESGNATSSLLHDYEEGSYTPVLSFGGTNASSPSWESGTYTKVGDRVFIDVRMSWSGGLGAATGDAKITLPFAVANSESNTQWEAIGSIYVLSAVTTGIVPAYSDVAGGLIFAVSQGSTTQADNTDFPSGSNFRVTGSYRTLA